MAQAGWLKRQGTAVKKQGVTLALLFGYIVVAMLLVQQDRTIESQRLLIRDLFHDSVELSVIKVKQASANTTAHTEHSR